jgi:hypothetical protein
MEAKIDKLVKDKEQSVPVDVIPLNAVPLIGVITIATTTITKNPSAIPVKVPDATDKLVKSMEYMTLQGEEIKRLQEEVENLQKVKSMFQSCYNTKMHKSQRITQEIQKLHKDTVMARTILEAKKNI